MQPSRQKIKCVIVDDTPIQLEILTEDLQKIPQIEILLATTDPVEAYSFLMDNQVDVAFLDIHMPVLTGMDIIEQFGNTINFIVITAYDDYGLKTHKYHGSIDFLLKPVSMDSLLNAVTKLSKRLEEQNALKNATRPWDHKLEETYKNFRSLYSLTDREEQITKLLTDGLSNKQIADKIFLAESTVAKHIQNIYKKSSVKSKFELIHKISQLNS
ncbi:response regulator transcription factor [Xanthocytophaga agilis]|uniref:Response regulator transcription factor n=1 Tax=Xanthocytophaga agilis TaxID=3048010 RepID=A0AAE3RCP9_9BACT|nr:response regulator transcription factor [Xanthocytophaga agilis]MDJ1505223.1 response regulator transcription factor [Xanthocytophaga agilis]